MARDLKLKPLKTGSAGTRTRNQRLKRALLYQLSYRPAREVSNPHQTLPQELVGRDRRARWTARRAVPTFVETRANRTANFFVDPSGRSTIRPHSQLANRALDRRRR